MDNVHAAVAVALAPFAPPPEPPALAAYRNLLRRHDWTHEFSDDARWRNRGRAELEQLRQLQRELDPDFRLWNAMCRPACKDGRAYS
jgi:hypothetical protein